MGTLDSMTRSTVDIRALDARDRTAALDLCAHDPVRNVYVAARMNEIDLARSSGAIMGHFEGGRLTSLCWTAANVVPVCGSTTGVMADLAHAMRPLRRRTSSLFGPQEQVEQLWNHLGEWWAPALDVRPHQPLMVMDRRAPVLVDPDPRVRPATARELDALEHASAAMFTEEIGYPPYQDARGRTVYRQIVSTLIQRRHTYVITEGSQVTFKADVGSNALGACQIQGVWMHPSLRGQGLAAGAMAAAVELARQHAAPTVSLYVNGFNAPAIATYLRVGFMQVGEFMTVLL